MPDNKKSKQLVEILHGIGLGDEKSIRRFYKEHYNSFLIFGQVITHDQHAIEDAIQQILIWFVEHPRRVSKLDRPDIYFYRSFRNQLISQRKKSQKRIEEELKHALSSLLVTESAETSWTKAEEKKEMVRRLEKEISELPHYLQQTLYLRYFSNLEYDHISAILEIKPNVARIYIHRAIEKLRKALKGTRLLIW